nr:MAG TPA: Protein of unknown function (DUF1372) [Caudoviricetes sp.]
MKDTLICILLAWSLIATCLLFMQRETQKPLLVYHADSKAQITGKVEAKKKIGSLFTITVNRNVFVVSEQKYNNTKIGDDIEL